MCFSHFVFKNRRIDMTIIVVTWTKGCLFVSDPWNVQSCETVSGAKRWKGKSERSERSSTKITSITMWQK